MASFQVHMAHSVFPELSGTMKSALLWRHTPRCWELSRGLGGRGGSQKAGWLVAFLLLQFIMLPGYALINICQVPSYGLLHLYDKAGVPVRMCPAGFQVKRAAQPEIILVSPELLSWKVTSEWILPDFGQATWAIPQTNLQPHGGLPRYRPKKDPIANEI